MKPIVRAGLAAGVIFVFFLVGFAPAFALEPPTREQIERYKLDGTLAMRIAQAKAIGNHKMPQRMMDRLGYKMRRLSLDRVGLAADKVSRILAPPPAWRGMPTSGTVKVLALLISFSDYPGTTTPEYFNSRLFGDGVGGPPFDSLRNFYRRSSYDQLTIEGNVLGWYQAPYARSTVAETDTGRQNLIKEALSFYEGQGHNFSQYDNDGDGAIDYFCVFWTGPHGEWSSFWWGYYTGFSDSTFHLDGKRLTNYSWQWELSNYPNGAFGPSTIIHETGHGLGVPDYYDYDDAIGPRGGVGGLDIMDGTGDHNCFSKFMLDWITPTVVSADSQTVTLRASGVYPDALLFMPGAVPGQIFNEFFMVQNRYRSGNDTNLFTGSDGLILWHVDSRLNTWNTNFVYDNSYTAHKLLRLMEADGLEDIETYNASANAGDYYKAGMTFGQFTVPSSARYDGLPSAMGMTNITGTTTPMSLTVFSSDSPPVAGIANIAAGQPVYGTIPVEATASDDNGISRVELYTDTMLWQTLTAPPFSFLLDTTPLSNGTHTIWVRAYDTILQPGTASVSVVTDNLFAPVSLKAAKLVNRSLLLREYVNVVSWQDNSRNTSVLKYRVYQVTVTGRALLTEIAKGPRNMSYRYLHRGVSASGTYVYEVVGVGNLDREGLAATATAR
ncbi:MAG: M6 family metalloprotease domain-containing protein [Acidobacteria bacterium]|nr:M6 family metalloprotease domain-containing protein [Acidobacteriota bacterium]